MSNEQIIPNIFIKLLRMVKPSIRLPRVRIDFRWTTWLGWKQWLVLFGFGVIVIAVEIHNHQQMWIEHKSGQTILTDHMLVGEIFIFGLILPVLLGLMLGYSGRTAIERDKMARALDLRRALVAKIHEAQTWHELASLIVKTPGNVVSVERSWLLVKRSDEEVFDQIANWERPGSALSPRYLPINPVSCEHCAAANTLNGTRILTCQCPDLSGNDFQCNRYCLWLSRKDKEKSVLLIDIPADRPLNSGQIKVLDDLGGEMSLAIDNANLHYVNQRQVENVINERQRIARDLHDTLGQNVSYLRLKLEQLQGNWQDPAGTRFQNDLSNMLKVADEAYEQVRDTLEELRVAEHIDLEKSIRLYADQVSERAGFSVDVQASGQPSHLSARQNRQIMYILREVLNNIEKHAKATNVAIRLGWRASEFFMTVHDDGIGFDKTTVNTEDRYGIAIMVERSRAINAKLEIDTSLGKGTNLTVCIPLSGSFVGPVKSV